MSVCIWYILQKPCQNVKVLIMKEKTKNEGREKCANPHDSCAISHSQHNGNAKKGLLLGSL